jgi:hypothetical protein
MPMTLRSQNPSIYGAVEIELRPRGIEDDPLAIRLSTSKNNWIRNTRRLERDPGALRDAKDFMLNKYEGIKLCALSATYNCYGLVFANRRTWVHEHDLELIFQDDGYRSLKNKYAAQVGDLVIYRETEKGPIVHAGVVARIDNRIETKGYSLFVLSQWGEDGEYLHREDIVPPLFGDSRQYWTHRPKEF